MATTQQNETTVREKQRKEAGAKEAVDEERRKEVGTEAAENILGPNPVVGLRGKDLFHPVSALDCLVLVPRLT